MSEERPKRRRWLLFQLRTLLIAVLLLILPLLWFAWRMERAGRQKEAVMPLLAKGAFVVRESDDKWEYGPPPNPAAYKLHTWYQYLLGKDFTDPVVEVVASCEEPGLVDFDLEHISSLKQLRRLDLFACGVTDEGLGELSSLSELDTLVLTNTKIGDSGLAHLHRLQNLKHLDLRGTQVTPEGVKKLQEALPNCKINY